MAYQMLLAFLSAPHSPEIDREEVGTTPINAGKMAKPTAWGGDAGTERESIPS